MSDTETAYTQLAERHGYGKSDRYHAILKFLMSPQQARMAAALPKPNEELAAEEGISVEKVKDELEDLYQKGVIFPRNFETREYFRFSRAVGQLHDATESLYNTKVYTPGEMKQIWTLWWDFVNNEWYPDRARGMKTQKTPHMRIIPAWKAIKDIRGVLPHENMKAIIEEAEKISIVSCSCRARKEAVGEPACEYSHDMNCLQFGRSAEYSAGRGHGKTLTTKEALAILEETEDDGLVHEWPNMDTMRTNTMCSCCDDCCMNMVPIKEYEVPWTNYYAKSRFEAQNDLEACNGCQDCIDRCKFDALSMEKIEGHKKLKATVDAEACVGCAVCVLVCEPKSLLMEIVRPPEHIPAMADAAR
ncbi:MAG: 4Fe-4S dicluster domain-containing protein [Pseudomonadales bacterium]|nr:4Fe-4S dicluster domain-containing protein [Pseudomonadales bacterium]HJN49879.1 4Fe-4S dicluster domain-containing protein [Pseudomonadales bacterium]